MSQNYDSTKPADNEIVNQVPSVTRANFDALLTNHSGATAPSGPVDGQSWWDTTNDVLKIYDSDLADWVDISSVSQEVIDARGSKSSLDQRLDVGHNDDGTHKSGLDSFTNEWIDPPYTNPTYISSTQFKVDGDQTDTLFQYRMVKVTKTGADVYDEVATSSYAGGPDETTVTLLVGGIDATMTKVEHGIITPNSGGQGSVAPDSLGLVQANIDDSDEGQAFPGTPHTADQATDLETELDAMRHMLNAVVSHIGGTAEGSTNWYDDIDLINNSNALPSNHHKNLVVKSNTIYASKVDIDADELVVKTSAGFKKLLTNVNETCDMAVSGVDGRQAGLSESANTTYIIHVIYNPTTDTISSLFSDSATAPTLPAGYTYFKPVGFCRNDSSQDIYRFKQVNDLLLYDHPEDDCKALNAQSSLSWTDLNISEWSGTTLLCKQAVINWRTITTSSASRDVGVRPKDLSGPSDNGKILAVLDTDDIVGGSGECLIGLDSSQTFQWETQNSSDTTLTIVVAGCKVIL
jgi:hypothetical protein